MTGNTFKAVSGIVAVLAALGFGALELGHASSPHAGIDSVSSLGVDKKKADPDKLIAVAAAYAKKWRSDADLSSVDITALGADGTVDLTRSKVTIVYASPSAAISPFRTLRDDSVRELNFVDDSMQDERGAPRSHEYLVRDDGSRAPYPHYFSDVLGVPGCSVKMLAAAFVKDGRLEPGRTLHVTTSDRRRGRWWAVVCCGNINCGPCERYDFHDCTPARRDDD